MTTLPSWTYLECFCLGSQYLFMVTQKDNLDNQFGQQLHLYWGQHLAVTTLPSWMSWDFWRVVSQYLFIATQKDISDNLLQMTGRRVLKANFYFIFRPSITEFYKGPVYQQWIALIQVFFYQLFDYWQPMGDAPPSRPRPSRHQDIFYPNIFIIYLLSTVKTCDLYYMMLCLFTLC